MAGYDFSVVSGFHTLHLDDLQLSSRRRTALSREQGWIRPLNNLPISLSKVLMSSESVRYLQLHCTNLPDPLVDNNP